MIVLTIKIFNYVVNLLLNHLHLHQAFPLPTSNLPKSPDENRNRATAYLYPTGNSLSSQFAQNGGLSRSLPARPSPHLHYHSAVGFLVVREAWVSVIRGDLEWVVRGSSR